MNLPKTELKIPMPVKARKYYYCPCCGDLLPDIGELTSFCEACCMYVVLPHVPVAIVREDKCPE